MFAIVQDVRYAIRTLARRPGFAVLAGLTLAIGIGAATLIYSVVDGVLLAPLPYRESGRLIAVSRTFPRWREREGLSARWDRIWFSYPAYRDWQSRQTSFESVGAWATSLRTLTGIDAAEQVSVVRATSSLSRALAIRPALGRFFLPGEDVVGARVALLSHNVWVSRFGAAPSVIGRSIRLDDDPYEIVGVLPERLDLGNRGRVDPIWVPAGGNPSDARAGSTDYFAIGRLRAGVRLDQATDETRRLVAESSPSEPAGARLAIWQEELTRSTRRPLFLLLGASLVLLLLACANVATLMLGEASGRTPEFATRLALGAGRFRVARQVVAECLVVVTSAVVTGTAAAQVGLRTLISLAPADLPRLSEVQLDVRVLAVTSVAGIATALLFALVPALALAAASPTGLLGTSSGRTTRRHEQWTLRLLVAGQVALSCLLLIGATLIARSVGRLSAVDPGFRSDRLVLVGLGTTATRQAATPEATTSFYASVAERLAAIPGVERAAVGSAAPFSGAGSSSTFLIEGQANAASGKGLEARRSHVLPGFLETLGVRLLAGRTIDGRDRQGAPLVAVVNETLARRFWPADGAIGKRLGFGDAWLTIVGVVSDVKQASLGDSTRITVYLPATQQDTPYLTVLVRTRLDPTVLAPAIRQAVATLDPRVPVTRIDEMPSLVSRSFASDRFRAVLISIFAVLAASLAITGVYGVTARAVKRQRRDIGIRIALGSTGRGIVGLFVQRASVAVALGVGVGLVGAIVASRLLAPYLYATNPADPTVYAAATALLVGATLLAAWLPAWRASRASPATVLRD